MREDLMLRAAELLEADAVKPDGIKFDLRAWARPSNITHEAFINDDEGRYEENADIPLNCNTAGCAVGLFALSGAFRQEGLGYFINGHGVIIPRFMDDNGQRWSNFDAAEELFEIWGVTHETPTGDKYSLVYWLFDSTSYELFMGAEAELEVAKRIRAAVAKYQSRGD